MKRAGQLLQAIKSSDAAVRRALTAVYGADPGVLADRIALLQRVLERYLDRFGDTPIVLFRSPGRINLRGMHVDTHGGYLNLMTHQREVILACGYAPDSLHRFVNLDPDFREAAFALDDLTARPAFQQDWMRFIQDPAVLDAVEAKGGDWENYLKGSMLRAAKAHAPQPMRALQGVVGSDLPRGAALSSSHALCVVTLLAALHLHQAALPAEEAVLAVRDAEWFTGARSGLSDQAAELLGGRNELVNVALFAEDYSTESLRRMPFPDGLSVLVINSYTRRSLSGAQRLAYTQNRFAYSMAMAILRQELRLAGYEAAFVDTLDRLARIRPEAFGGQACLLEVLQRIPALMPIKALQERYKLPDFATLYEQYFGGVDPDARPESLALRGPLLFGVAESERARAFLPALEQGDYAFAGKLMNWGHDGDRVVDAAGAPWQWAGDLAASSMLVEAPGAYGASSRILDALVDQARAAGALGASLTGAGIAGAVLALCRRDQQEALIQALRGFFTSEAYRVASGREAPLTQAELDAAVVVNHAPAGAGELAI